MQEIVIVGGGMAGLALALLLSQQNGGQRSITVLEKAPQPQSSKKLHQPSFDARSTALSAGSAHILDDLGCWQDLQHKTQAIQHIHVSDQYRFGGCQLKSEDYQKPALGYVVENRHLGQALLAAVADSSVNLVYSASIQQCLPKSGSYKVIFKDNKAHKHSIDASLLVLADGTESGLRQQMGIDTQKKDYGQVALVANVALASPHQGVAYERFTPEGPLALLPLPASDGKHRASLVWTRDKSRQDWLEQASENELLGELRQCLGHRPARLAKIGKRQVYPLGLRQSDEQVRSSLVVLGNAAHTLHPVAGQGFNLTLRDCLGLAQTIARHHDKPPGQLDVLQAYERKRSADQQRTIGITDGLVDLFSSGKHRQVWARQAGFWGLNHLPWAKKHFGSIMMGRSSQA